MIPNQAELKVESAQQKQRLDLWLAFQLPQYSRSSVRKLLDSGKVQVNNVIEYRPNYKMNDGDMVVVSLDTQIERQALPPYALKLDIVYQDEHLVVVNKPNGLKVHPTHPNETQTLINAAYYTLADKVGAYGVNLINRIDKETSGLVMLAVSPQGAWHYAKQFAGNQVHKEYLAVVDSRWMSKHGTEPVTVSNFIRYDEKLQRQAVVQTRGEHAHTDFQYFVECDDPQFVVIVAKPYTGRTHQIRVHLEHLKSPILGDQKYGGLPYSRLMLHAYRVAIPKLGGGKLEVEAPIPSNFAI